MPETADVWSLQPQPTHADGRIAFVTRAGGTRRPPVVIANPASGHCGIDSVGMVFSIVAASDRWDRSAVDHVFSTGDERTST